MMKNYIFPFLWMRGESEKVIRTEMKKINEAGIGAVCLEARPHPDFAGEGWWHDVDIVLDEAKKRNMKVWILDDAHFPTGQANGQLPVKYPDRAREYVYTQFSEITGPVPYAQLDIELLTKKQFTWLDFGKPKIKPVREKQRVLSVTAYQVIKGDVIAEEGISLTENVQEGILTWDVPAGTWRIFVNFITTDFGAKPEYINYISRESVQVLIESVYEAHYQRYKKEFGKTIMGFFSDEPGFYNTDDLKMDDKIGYKNMPLPWCEELETGMTEILQTDWTQSLPYLWFDDEKRKCDNIRFVYMNCVTRLYEQNFSKQLGEWCRSHGVKYIGHVIEDNGQHTRLGCGAGHYFRAMAGQDMAGIDNIGNQIVPGNPDSMRHNPAGKSDSEFFHFGLGKLGASAAQIDPHKQGRLFCETFGAYGWGLGVKNCKWLIDFLVAQGVNHFVPHAFSMAEYPDDDCPPHFYARGNNPQYPFFGELMRYTNRLCTLFNQGENVPQAAILYEAEGDWAGKSMRSYIPGRILTENQIDYEILPADVFENAGYYHTYVEDGKLIVNGRQMSVLIIPETEYLSENVAEFLIRNPKLPVLFINSIPKAQIGSEEKKLQEELKNYPIVPIGELKDQMYKMKIFDVLSEKECKHLIVYHYKKKQHIYFFFNTSLSEDINEKIILPIPGKYVEYNASDDKWYTISQDGQSFQLRLKPYESFILVINPDVIAENRKRKISEEINISDQWEVILKETEKPSECKKVFMDILRPISQDYRNFSGVMEYRKKIHIKDMKENRMILQPEYVYECMEVIINGQHAGKRICPPYDIDISDFLKEGENLILIRVVNTLLRNANTMPGIFGPDRSVMEPSGMFGTIKLIQTSEIHDSGQNSKKLM